MNQPQPVAKTSPIVPFGKAFLDYVRNLPAQLLLVVTYVLADVQASATVVDKLMWKAVAVACLLTAGVAAIFNILSFMREAPSGTSSRGSRFVAQVTAAAFATAVPLPFVVAAVFNARSLLRAVLPHVAS